MSELTFLKSFDNYVLENPLYESLGDGGQTSINRAFLNRGPIPLSNGETINPRDIVKVVTDAVTWIAVEFRTYYSFARDANIIYVVNDPRCTTMAVDQYLNIYMDVLFIYNDLQMNTEYVAAIIMHEIFHVVYNHIERGKNWLSAHGKPINDLTDTNLAGDVEVNTTLINKGIISEDDLVNNLKGLYLRKKDGGRTNLPMEMILEDEKLMNKLRGMVKLPSKVNNGGGDGKTNVTKQTTTPEWDNGYKEGWNKITDMCNKYGAEETIKKLQEIGLVDMQGQLITDKLGKLEMLEFIYIKSFNDFLFESEQPKFESHDDGYIAGVQKAISTIFSSVFGGQDGGQGGGGGDIIAPDTKLSKDDLNQMNLPSKDNQSGGQSGPDDGMPTNTKQESNGGKGDDQNQQSDGGQSGQQQDEQDGQNSQSGGNQSGKQQSGKQSGGGGDSSGDLDGDANTLADDLKNKSRMGGGKSSKSNEKSDEQSGDQGGRGDQDDNQKGGQKGQNDENTSGQNGKSGQGGEPQYSNQPQYKGGKKQNSIGNTGSFMDDTNGNLAKSILENSGYSKEDIDEIVDGAVEKNKRLNSPEGIAEKRKKLYSKLSSSDPIKKLLDNIEVSEAKYKNIWKKIMKQFLGQSCRKAGNDIRSSNFDWKNKRSLSLGRLSPRFHKEAQEPQNINMYVDVSGSVNIKLLEVIAKSISIFCEQYKYSGINIIPWASRSTGIHEVKSVNKSSAEKVTKEILGYISKGVSECGGGTDLITACGEQIVAVCSDKTRKKKDDKHIIITDGETFGEEKQIEQIITKGCGAIVNKNCFWMIYDASPNIKESWEKSIRTGTLLFINSEIVIGNN